MGPLPGDRQRVIEYDIKENDWVGELVSQLVSDKTAKERVTTAGDSDDAADDDDADDVKDQPKWAQRLKQASSVADGMKRLYEEAPAVYFMQGGRIQPMLAQSKGDANEKLFTLADFSRPRLDLSKPVLLHGKTNTGKTEFAEAHFESPTIVRTRDDLKRATFFSDGIIFDDFDFSTWKAEELIHLLSWNKSRSLPARYCDAHIEANTPIIITSNKKPKKLFTVGNSAQRHAIARRFRPVKVDGPLRGLGGRFTVDEMRARREAGRNGPRGPPQAQGGQGGPRP